MNDCIVPSEFIQLVCKVRHIEKQILKAKTLREMLLWMHMLSIEWDNLDMMIEQLNYQPDLKIES